MPFTVHVTAASEFPLTVALNATPSPKRIDALAGLIVTVTFEEVVPPPTAPAHAAFKLNNPRATRSAR
jgi:hypothetical protein